MSKKLTGGGARHKVETSRNRRQICKTSSVADARAVRPLHRRRPFFAAHKQCLICAEGRAAEAGLRQLPTSVSHFTGCNGISIYCTSVDAEKAITAGSFAIPRARSTSISAAPYKGGSRSCEKARRERTAGFTIKCKKNLSFPVDALQNRADTLSRPIGTLQVE
jgi:hypothetical protein